MQNNSLQQSNKPFNVDDFIVGNFPMVISNTGR